MFNNIPQNEVPPWTCDDDKIEWLRLKLKVLFFDLIKELSLSHKL